MNQINREQFLVELGLLKAGLSPREFIEQSTCIVFQDGVAMTFNDEVCCRKKIAGTKAIRGAVKASALFSILEKIPDELLEVRCDGKGELAFKGKNKAFGLVKEDEIYLPVDRVETPGEWRELPDNFAENVRKVRDCVSHDESRFVLTCVHLTGGYMESCDNEQLIRVRCKLGLEKPVLVRGAALGQLVDLGMREVSVSASWAHFRNEDGLLFSCRLYQEDYPKLDELLKVKGHTIKIPSGLNEAADRAAVFAGDGTGVSTLTVKLNDNLIRLKGEGILGWYRETQRTEYDGPKLEFTITPYLLKTVSETYREARISESRLKVTGTHYVYITSLNQRAEKDEEDAGE